MGGRVRGRGVRAWRAAGHGGTTRSRLYGKALRIFYKNFRLPSLSCNFLVSLLHYLHYVVALFEDIFSAYSCCLYRVCRRPLQANDFWFALRLGSRMAPL